MTFIKWLGGNASILSSLEDYFPCFHKVNGYIDPFLGGGNVFQKLMTNHYDELRGKPIYLSDINKGLINSYRIVRDNIDELMTCLEIHQKLHSEKHYNDVKKEYNSLNHLRDRNDLLHDIEDAARFIYLSNNTFGWMWRENRIGKMNSSFGKKSEFNFNYSDLYLFSKLLTDTYINAMSFEDILKMSEYIKEYFVYLSPPYDNINASFKHHNFKRFDRHEFAQRPMLLPVFRKLDKIGCKVMMSNSNKYSIKKEFAGYNIFEIQTDRYKGASFNNRRSDELIDAEKLKELIITNYPVTKKQKTIDEAWGPKLKIWYI